MAEKKKLTIERVEKRIRDLPLLPSVVCELMTLDSDSPDFFHQVATLTKSAPSLATRVLQYVNSASSAPATPINNLQQALVRVGSKRIATMVTMLAVTKVFMPSTDQQKALWQHSLEVAHLAEFLAQHLDGYEVDRDLAYTCGLLHDIGRFVMFQVIANSIDVIDTQGWDSPEELPEVEEQILGFTHGEVGFLAAKKWRLPKPIMQIIRYHHRYDIYQREGVAADFKQLLVTVQLADFISVYIERHPDWQSIGFAPLEAELIQHCQQHQLDLVLPPTVLQESLSEIQQQCDAAMLRLKLK